MASLNLKNIYKVYPNGTKAVNDFSMDIEDKEFIVFVGPSGCGKSTVLRMIAGLEEISAGELKIDSAVVNDVECKLRDTAMVFQNYALYPHMTVAENMAFPLKMAKLTKEEKEELSRQTDEKYPLYRKMTPEEKAELKQQVADSKPKVELTAEDKAQIKTLVKEAYPRSLWNLITLPLHRYFVKKDYIKQVYHYEEMHMPSVWNNILKPYHKSKVKNENMYSKVEATAKILGLEEYLSKKPGAMSGGQRQRVALGRAMVRNPKVFLLDEPLSNLDAKLRTQMRSEITKLHERLQTTFIYVTHDQTEAMTMGDRIVVMKKGRIQQIDTPLNLYAYPANLFVAGFIGTPSMNFFDAKVEKKGDKAEITFANGKTLTYSSEHIRKLERKYLGKDITFGVRPEDFCLSDDGAECIVTGTELLGSETLIYCDFDTSNVNGYENSPYSFIVKVEGVCRLVKGDIIKVNVDFAKVHYFDKQSEESVMKRFVSYNDIDASVAGGKLNIGTLSAQLPEALKELEGDYRIIFPSEAVKKGKDYAAQVCECEEIAEGFLARLDIGGVNLYGLFPECVSGNINVDIEWHKISFTRGADGEEVVKSALNTENSFDIKLNKRALKGEEKKALPDEEFRKFDVDVVCEDKRLTEYKQQKGKAEVQVVAGENGVSETVTLTCPYHVLKRLLGASDRKLFGVPMSLKFSEDGIKEGGQFKAEVKEVYDYGSKKYALCSCMGVEITVPFTDGAELSFDIDLTKASIYEEKSGIKIT